MTDKWNAVAGGAAKKNAAAGAGAIASEKSE
jgi:hypothetical protein